MPVWQKRDLKEIEIPDGSITTPKLANDAVTTPKLSPQVRAILLLSMVS